VKAGCTGRQYDKEQRLQGQKGQTALHSSLAMDRRAGERKGAAAQGGTRSSELR
jgi:hypothetical protein